MVIRVLSRHLLIPCMWVLAASTDNAKRSIFVKEEKETTRHSPYNHEIESRSLNEDAHIKYGATTLHIPHVPGQKLSLGALAIYRVLWYGADGGFRHLIEEFKNIETKDGWSPLNWLKFSKHERWDKQMLKILDIVKNRESNEEKRPLMLLLRSTYESVPKAEKN
uniref:AlNc14C378G11197 protein n=1 Tax=Albugo laibachii Nc14 TaxID=890382 RepID=F0WYD7_9STRA|nr:AlNc14C378G11197 [Albugo laibachii Nc14]|eukprot:CCA26490.1 AlNc14C378G11197 [Albugo laibachii Nc14]